MLLTEGLGFTDAFPPHGPTDGPRWCDSRAAFLRHDRAFTVRRPVASLESPSGAPRFNELARFPAQCTCAEETRVLTFPPPQSPSGPAASEQLLRSRIKKKTSSRLIGTFQRQTETHSTATWRVCARSLPEFRCTWREPQTNFHLQWRSGGGRGGGWRRRRGLLEFVGG